jgi:hypothetical protein
LPPSSPLPISSEPNPSQEHDHRPASEDDPFGFLAVEKTLKLRRDRQPPAPRRPALLARNSSVQSQQRLGPAEVDDDDDEDENRPPVASPSFSSEDEPVDPLVTPHKPHRNRKRKPLTSPSLSRSSSLSSHPSIPSSPSPVKPRASTSTGLSPPLVSPFPLLLARTTASPDAPRQKRAAKGKQVDMENTNGGAKVPARRLEVLLPKRASRRANAAVADHPAPSAKPKRSAKSADRTAKRRRISLDERSDDGDGDLGDEVPKAQKKATKATARRGAPQRPARKGRAPRERADEAGVFDEVPKGRATRSSARAAVATRAGARPKTRTRDPPHARARRRPRAGEGPSFVLDSDEREVRSAASLPRNEISIAHCGSVSRSGV